MGMAKPNALAILGSTILKYHNLQLDDISQMVTKYTKYQLISNKLLTVQKTKNNHIFPPFRAVSPFSFDFLLVLSGGSRPLHGTRLSSWLEGLGIGDLG